jgi:plasmid maintenance system antidote protein VapI
MDWQAIIKTVAPWIGTALGGPLGGMAVEAAANALGVPTKTTDAIQQALAGVTPDQMLALKKADQDFSLQMQALGFKQLTDLEATAAGDRKDARAMQIATRSALPFILSIVVTVGYFGVLVGMMLGVLHVNDSQALLLMLGSLGTGWGMVMAFNFGTTADSGRKTDLLAQAPAIK